MTATAPDIPFLDDEPGYYTYRPRRDQPDRFDQQESFYNSRLPGVAFLVGGNGSGCLAAEQEVYDPVAGLSRKVSEIDSDFHIWARTKDGKRVVAKAMRPRIYGVEDLFEVGLSNGQSMRVTQGHRVLTPSGWMEIGRSLSEQEVIGGDGCRIISDEGLAIVLRCEFIRRDAYWDFHVPEYENYWMNGVWNHNTTSTALAKVAKFVLSEQPPPRKDTPFWIIAGSYEQACETCWNEKLFQHGHIPEAEIDRERIQWYKPNRNWPFAVPLKPWPVQYGGHPNKNWILEFKSYEQGRSQMQARSVGGFLFVEQFPWGLLEEVLRGCREYNFPGSKLAEFTPVDPNLSRELDDMIDEDRLPDGWEIFRANTECAMEAGHVSKTWFNEFFGMVPEQMRLTRMTGARPQYEGAIYPNFDPLIHATGPDVDLSDFPQNVHFRRGIDWGGGPNNAFVCLWAYKNGLGQWFVFDEYYSTAQDRTTIDHLCEVADRWPWPIGNPHYGTTWADPSSPDNLRIAQKLSMYTEGKYDGLSMGAAYNRVREGIEHVQWLLKCEPSSGKPRLLIDKKSCPNLVREMRTYRYLRASGTGLNPADARGEPLKKDDHAVDALRYLVASEANMTGLMTESFRRADRKRERGIHLVGGKS